MTRNDLILILILIILSLIPLKTSFGHKKAVVRVDGFIFREIELSNEEIFTINSSSGGKNVIEVKNSSIRVVEADCSDKICVKTGAISDLGGVIACVPHKLLIEVVESNF